MDHVSGIEQLGDGSVDILPGLLEGVPAGDKLGVVDVVELKALSTIRSVVLDVGITAVPVFMSENVVTPGNSSVADRRTVRETVVTRVWIISDGQGVPTQRTSELVIVLRLDGTVSFARIVDTPLEDIVSRETPLFPGEGSVGIGSPVDNGDDLVRSVSGDGSFVPVVLHLNLELPNEIEVGGIAIGYLNVGQTSLDRVDSLGDIADEFDREVSFAADEVGIHI